MNTHTKTHTHFTASRNRKQRIKQLRANRLLWFQSRESQQLIGRRAHVRWVVLTTPGQSTNLGQE